MVGLVAFSLTIIFLKDYEVLERYRYLIAFAGIALLLMPRLPGIGETTNEAYLSVKLGPLQLQPTDLAKICIVVFLASYLNEKREVLVVGARTVAGIVPPPLKHLGPLLVIWGAAMVMLVFIRDLGDSLMFFGAFLAMIYVATARISFVLVGLAMFVLGAWFFANTVGHVQDRFDIWLDLRRPRGRRVPGGAVAVRPGPRRLVRRALGSSLVQLPQISDKCAADFPNCGAILPAPHTDFIYAVIVNQLGLFGGGAVVLIYALITQRGFKTAILADDGFEPARHRADDDRRPAGVRDHRRGHQGDPDHRRDAAVHQLRGQLDRRQLHPAGAAALGLGQGEAAGSPRARGGRGRVRMNPQIVKLFGVVLVLYVLLFGFTSYWSIFDSEGLEANVANKRPLLEEQRIERGEILAADGKRDRDLEAADAGATGPSCGSIPRATSTGTRSGTRSSSGAGSGSSSPTTTSWWGRRPNPLSSSTRRGAAEEGSDVQTALDPEAPGDGGRSAGRPEGLGRRARPAIRRGADDGQHSPP